MLTWEMWKGLDCPIYSHFIHNTMVLLPMMMLVLLVLVPVVKYRSGRSPRRSPKLFAMEKEQCQAPLLFSSAWDRWPGWSANMISLFNFTSVGTKPELRLRQRSVWGTILALSQEAKEHSVMHAQSAFIATF